MQSPCAMPPTTFERRSDRTGGKCAEGRTAQRQVDRREDFDFVSANISQELRGIRYLRERKCAENYNK